MKTIRLQLIWTHGINNQKYWTAVDWNNQITGDGVTGYKAYGVLQDIGDYSHPKLPMEFDRTYQDCIIWDGFAVLNPIN